MPQNSPASGLPDILNELGSLTGPEDLPRVRELEDRLDAGDLRVLLVGEAKRGKSTLANALLGRAVMPTGVTPVTALPTLVVHGSPERLDVLFTDGTELALPLDEVGQFVTQQQNPENVKGVELVRVVTDRGLPHERMVLVDSPGVGSVFGHNTRETETALQSMDIALLVLTSDAPMSQSEAALLRRVADLSVEVMVVLNKVDLLAPEEATEAREFVTVSAAAAVGYTPVTLVCSGRHGTGVEDLRETLRLRLEEQRLPALHASVAAAARRLTARRLDEDVIAHASIRALQQDRAAEVSAFADAVAETRLRKDEILRLSSAEVSRLGGVLLESARTRLDDSSRAVRAALDSFLSHAPRDPAEAEDQGREVIAGAVRTELEQWMATQAEVIRESLERQRDRAHRALEESARSLEQAAQRLLGVELSAAVPVLPSQRLPQVTYDFDPAPDWNQALVTAVRRHGPGARRRVARHLRELARDLADKHLGRARLALQQGLEEGAGSLARAVGEAFDEQSAGLARAHDHALRLRDRSSSALAAEADRLALRINALRRLHAQLEPNASEQTAGAS